MASRQSCWSSGTDQAPLGPSQRIRLEQLAARHVLGEGFRPEDAVSAAAELVAEEIEVEGVVALASLPADPKRLAGDEVEAEMVAFAPEVIAAADRFLADR